MTFNDNTYEHMMNSLQWQDDLKVSNKELIQTAISLVGFDEFINMIRDDVCRGGLEFNEIYYTEVSSLESMLILDIAEAIEEDIVIDQLSIEPTDTEGHNFDAEAVYKGKRFSFSDGIYSSSTSYEQGAALDLINQTLYSHTSTAKPENAAERVRNIEMVPENKLPF